ncbi:MAG: flagellar biosynthetic protein FliO [Bacillota bacterium]
MAAAFYTTKFIGKHGLPRASAKNMHVIERLSLGVDKTLFIVRVGDAYYLISATKQAVTLLDKLEKNCLIEDGENPSENILKTRFSVYFDKFLNTKSKMSVEDDQDFDFQYNDDFTESLKSRLADLKKRSDEIKGLSDKDENR